MMYRHTADEIVVDSFTGKDWGDFMIVTIDAPNMTPEMYVEMGELFSQYSSQMGKEIILVPKDMDIEFYGVEVDDNEPNR